MKYTILTVLGLLVLLSVSVVAAGISFSPTSLIYKMKVGETVCKNIYYNTNTEKANIEDYWLLSTQTAYLDWYELIKTTGNRQDSITQVTNTFPTETSGSSSGTQVCITANEAGTYRGALLIKGLNQQGNQVVQGAIWIKVTAV